MKAYSMINRHQMALNFLWILVCLFFLTGSSSVQTDELAIPVLIQPPPPTPQEPVTNLQMPAPVRPEQINGKATLPAELTLGFAMDVADIMQGGDWQIQGRVLFIENQTVNFSSEKGEIGHLVFRLPEGMSFPQLRPEQPISIQNKFIGYESSLGYELQVASLETLVLASGRLIGGEPQKADLGPGVLLQQVSERSAVIGENKYETTYQVNVILIIDGVSMEIFIGKPTDISINGLGYLLLVTHSDEVRPTKEYEGVAEGRGYYLEYVMTLK